MIPTVVYEDKPDDVRRSLHRLNWALTISVAVVGGLLGFLIGLLIYGTGDDGKEDECRAALYDLSDYTVFLGWMRGDYQRAYEAVWTGDMEGFTADLTPDALATKYFELVATYPGEAIDLCLTEGWES